MSEHERPHPFTSYSLPGAWEKFSDPDLLKAWKEAPSQVRRVRHHGIQQSYSLRRGRRRRIVNYPNPDKRQMARKIHIEIVRKLKTGCLVAWGRDGRPTGNWVQIQKDAWNYLRLNFKTGMAFLDKVESYYNIQISRSVILDNKWENGLTLKEAIELLEAYEELNQSAKSDEELSESPDETQPFQDSWKCIENGIYTTRDLFLWVQETGTWVNLLELFDGQDPDFELVSLEKSTIRFLNHTGPVRCLVSNIKTPPLGGSVGTIQNGADGTKRIKYKQDLDKLYLERLNNFEEQDLQSPTREEDEKWAMDLGHTRERAREVRRKYLPKEKSKPGRRPQNK